MPNPQAVLAAIAIAIPFPFLVRLLVARASSEPERPAQIPDDVWSDMIKRTGGGPYIGSLELLLSVLAFSFGAETLVAGWLAFKLASKWAAWQHVVQVPERLSAMPDLQWHGVRSAMGNFILIRDYPLTTSTHGISFPVSGQS